MFDRNESMSTIPSPISVFTLAMSVILLMPGCSDAEDENSIPAQTELHQVDATKADESIADESSANTISPSTPSQSISSTHETPDKLSADFTKVTVNGVTPVDADTAARKFDLEYLSDTFTAVAEGIAFEPYAGVLRGAKGTALAGSGNAIDQALLLASALDGHVAAWRIAQGSLTESNLSAVLSTVGTPRTGNYSYQSADPDNYDPISDEHFREVTRDHFWLEIQREQGDEWLALDPVYPDANFGDTAARKKRHFTNPPTALQQRIELSFMQQTADGRKTQLGKVAGDVADLALYPIVLVARGIPQFEGEQATTDEPKGDLGTSGGSLLGGGRGGLFDGGDKVAQVEEPTENTEPDEVTGRALVGTEYRRELTYAGNDAEFLKATQVVDAEPASKITREWIEFTLSVPGLAARKIERDLFDAELDGNSPAVVRRYSIALVTGKVSREMFEGYRAKLDLDQINNARAQLMALKDQTATNELALEIMKLESASALTPHLINLAFALESDELSERLATGAGINIIRDIPRILITTVETGLAADGSATTNTTLDLRLDEVRAVPRRGMSSGTKRLFQRARGMQESSLEGRLLAHFVDDPDVVVTTTRVMQEAQVQGNRLLMAAPDHRTVLDEVSGAPARVLARMNATLDTGHRIILPAGPAIIAGVKHWGWWDVDPATGAFVGVMDGGQHQAMSQYVITSEEVGLNDDMAFAIGGIVGATATLTLYSAKMLEYGRMTPNLLKEVAHGIEALTCVTCPSYEVKITAALERSSESSCEEKDGVSFGVGGGVSGQFEFCESYKKGITCAASLMLGTYEETVVDGFVAEKKLDLGPLSCEQWQ